MVCWDTTWEVDTARASTALADLKQGDKVDNMIYLQAKYSKTEIFFVLAMK